MRRQKDGGQRKKSKRKGARGRKRAKGKGPKVLPVQSAAGDGPRFVVEEPQDTIRRLKSTGHGRLKPIMLVEDPEKSPADDGIGRAAGFLDETVKEGVFPDMPNVIAADLDYDDISFGDALGENGAGLIEDMPEEKWDFGAKEAQFGAHKGWARKDTDDEFAVVDGEWDTIMKKIDAGIGDDDLNINDKIEEYLRDAGGLTSGIGVDLPVAEINNLILSDIWNVWNSNRTLPLRIRLLNVTNTSIEHFEKNIKPGCSPFIAYNNGYEAITSQMNAEWKGYFDDLVAKPSSLTLASSVAVGLLLLYMYRGNSMLAQRVASEQNELRLQTECDGLRMRNKAINHQLELRRRQQAAMLQ
eukprot:g1473.t1